jgi:hypothetical protein
MNLLKHRDGTEGHRERKAALDAEFARRRELDEQRVRNAPTGPTMEEAEALAKARIAASTAARVERKQQVEDLQNFRSQVEQIKGLAESNRHTAILNRDFESAVEAAHRAAGLEVLVDEINASGRHVYGGQWK